MEWEPVLILGVTGGAMLICAVRSVIDTRRCDRPAGLRRVAPVRRARSKDIVELSDRVAMLEWIAAPAARAVAGNETPRRGAA